MRTLCFAKEERKSERERERPRKNSIIRRVVNLKKGRHTKSQIFWFWTLEEREREIASKPIARSYRVLPGSHDNLQTVVDAFLRFLRRKFRHFKKTDSYLIMQSVCVCNKLAFLSSDAANFFWLWGHFTHKTRKALCLVSHLGFYSNPKLKRRQEHERDNA